MTKTKDRPDISESGIGDDLRRRFGDAAGERGVRSILRLVGDAASVGSPGLSPAPSDIVRGSMAGFAIGETLGLSRPADGWPGTAWVRGPFTQLMLMTADAVLSDPCDHPARFAARLRASTVRTSSEGVRHAQSELRAGEPWWGAGARYSAGVGGAARCVPIGLAWSGDPDRAAYEAVLSAMVTNAHPGALEGAAIFASALALAVSGDCTLGDDWFEQVLEVSAAYEYPSLAGRTHPQHARPFRAHLHAAAELSQELRESVLDHSAVGRIQRRIGTGAVAWEAIPAAMCFAASSSEPHQALGAAAEVGGAPHLVTALAGAILGAHQGMNAWPTQMTEGHGLSDVLRTADRLASATKPEPQSSDDDSTDPVHVWMLLDRSGSMSPRQDAVVSGVNEFLNEQRAKPGECAVTMVQFDGRDPYEVLIDAAPIETVPDLTSDQYTPRGSTPLYDAVGRLIAAGSQREHATGSQREDFIVFIFTDGHENASREYTGREIHDLVEQKKADGWAFVFMGANQDSWESGTAIGVSGRNTRDWEFSDDGVHASMAELSRSVGQYRERAFHARLASRDRIFDE